MLMALAIVSIAFDSLYKGQEVMIQGFKLDDGRVVAARVQVQQP